MVPIVGDGFSCTWRETHRFSYFLTLVRRLDWHFAVAKSQTKSCAIFQNFYPRNRTFGSSIHTGSAENFQITFFGKIKKTRCNKLSGFVAVMSTLARIPHKLSDPSPSHPKTSVFFQSICIFSSTNLNNRKRKNFDCCVFGKMFKKLFVDIFRLSHLGSQHPNVPSQR